MFPTLLRRDILVLLAVKAGFLALLYFLFFSPAHRPPVTAEGLRAHIMGQ